MHIDSEDCLPGIRKQQSLDDLHRNLCVQIIINYQQDRSSQKIAQSILLGACQSLVLHQHHRLDKGLLAFWFLPPKWVTCAIYPDTGRIIHFKGQANSILADLKSEPQLRSHNFSYHHQNSPNDSRHVFINLRSTRQRPPRLDLESCARQKQLH